MRLKINVLLLIFISVMACDVAGSIFRDVEKGYSLLQPEGWKIERNTSGGEFLFRSPKFVTLEVSSGSITVVTEKLPHKVTSEEYMELCLAGMTRLYNELEIKSKTKTMIGDLDGFIVGMEYRMMGMEMKMKLVTCVREYNACTLGCASIPSEFDFYSSTFDRVIESFRYAGPLPGMEKQSTPGKFHSDKHGFTIHFPDNWELRENFSGSLFSVISPQENKEDTFRENLNVTVEKPPGTPSLEDYISLFTMQIKMMSPKYEEKGRGSIKLGKTGAEYLSAVYQVGKLSVHGKIYVLKNNRDEFIVLTFTAAPETFEKHKDQFHSIAKSIVFD